MKINYDVTIPETQTAFKAFWRKYSLRRTVMFSLVFAIGIYIAVTMIAEQRGIIGFVLLGLSAGFLANLWLKPRRAVNKLSAALELMEEERYEAVFGAEQIEISTMVGEEIVPSVFSLAAEELYSSELPDMFLLFVNRSLIYAFPKRCLSPEEADSLRAYFAERKI
jgi:hypothetical protein